MAANCFHVVFLRSILLFSMYSFDAARVLFHFDALCKTTGWKDIEKNKQSSQKIKKNKRRVTDLVSKF